MKTVLQFVLLLVLALPSAVLAQPAGDVPPPPLPPPLPSPEQAPDEATLPAGGATPEESVQAEPRGVEGSTATNRNAAPGQAAPTKAPAARAEAAAPTQPQVQRVGQHEDTRAEHRARARARALTFSNTLTGPSGVLRVISADAADAGTFRLSLIGSFFSGSDFLCPACTLEDGTVSEDADDVSVYSQHFQLSVTATSFLEVSAALRYQQTTDSLGSPSVFHISGDSALGARGFWPVTESQMLNLGGGGQLGLLTRGNGVGIGAANVALHLESTLDLTPQTSKDASGGLPLRGHMNLGYLFDNSGQLVETLEADRSDALGSRQRITRIERFGKDIDRVDSLRLGAGLEGVFPHVRPFAEWTLDLPVNRQGYTCYSDSTGADDQCLSQASFAAIPSRLSVGVRGYPWFSDWSEGLSLLAAIDIATGGSSSFLEEVAPELPWNLHFGLGYAFDTEPRLRIEHVEKLRVVTRPVPPEPFVEGTVVDQETGEGIERASVVFEDGEHQGLLTDSHGKFRSLPLKPGRYDFTVSKDGYADGECSVTLESASIDEPGGTTTDAATPRAQNLASPVRCELSVLPVTGNITGAIQDIETSTAIAGVNVRITDLRGRSLTLSTDELGGFRFENVPQGSARLDLEVEGYLPVSIEVDVEPRDTVTLKISLKRAQ